MYEKFTDRARTVMALAHRGAVHGTSQYIFPMHVLCGILNVPQSVGWKMLSVGDVRQRVEVAARATIKSLEDLPNHRVPVPQAPSTKAVIETTIAEGKKRNHNWVGTEHLLYALATENRETRDLLSACGFTPEVAKAMMDVHAAAQQPLGTFRALGNFGAAVVPPKSYTEAMAEALEEMTGRVVAGGWIAAEEEPQSSYLVLIRHARPGLEPKIRLGFWDGEAWRRPSGRLICDPTHCDCRTPVTHWCPIPPFNSSEPKKG